MPGSRLGAAPGDRTTMTMMAVLLAAALALRLGPALFHPGINRADEIFQSLEQAHRVVYGATGRQKHGTVAATGTWAKRRGSRVAAMATRLKRGARRSRRRLRKQVVEPVFGQIKQARSFRQFLRRGLAKPKAEWAIFCAVHNLLKLAAVRRCARSAGRIAIAA
jgi:hypothetical protein